MNSSVSDFARVMVELIARGVVSSVLGDCNGQQSLTVALVLWAHRPPGRGFDAHIALGRLISREPITVFVDDELPGHVFNRSKRAQSAVNATYVAFFEARNCRVVFSSSLRTHGSFQHLLYMAGRLPLAVFLQMLPARKQQMLGSLTVTELVHALTQLALFDLSSTRANVVIVPRFAQAMASTHRKISKTPLVAVVTPAFRDIRDVQARLRHISAVAASVANEDA